MVKHIILWQLKEEFSEIQKAGIKNAARRGLEGLKGKIDGLIDIKVNINPLETSNCDMMLDTTFESFEALKAYSSNPLHQDVANAKVRPYLKNRFCMDYEI